MSPARQHRERFAAAAAGLTRDASADLIGEGGPAAQAAAIDSPAAEHRMRQSAAQVSQAGDAGERRSPAEIEAQRMSLRLTHDLRRLKEIQSIERKIDAKREMLPEYRAWCDGVLAAEREPGAAVADEIVPTMMIWSIDVGEWDRALELASFVLGYDVALPARYQRSAPALVAEEVATVALKVQAAGEVFPLDVLEQVEAMTAAADMHDEIRAKLMKAIGVELARGAEADAQLAPRAIETLRRAQALHERVGVKDRIRRLEKLVGDAAQPPAANDNAG